MLEYGIESPEIFQAHSSIHSLIDAGDDDSDASDLARVILRSLQEYRQNGRLPMLGPDIEVQVNLLYMNGIPAKTTSIVILVSYDPMVSNDEVREIVRPHVYMALPGPEWMCDEEKYLVNPDYNLYNKDITYHGHAVSSMIDDEYAYEIVAHKCGLSVAALKKLLEKIRPTISEITSPPKLARTAEELFGVTAKIPTRQYHKSRSGAEFSDDELKSRALLSFADAICNDMKGRKVLSPEDRAVWNRAKRFTYHARKRQQELGL